MKSDKGAMLPRRGFLASSSFLMPGASLLGATASPEESQGRGADLREELTPAEIEIVNRSDMAKDLANCFGKGYSCAESGLLVGVRRLKKPEELVWIAGGFGGGLGHRDLCGFLTAGVMTLGLYAGTMQTDRKAAKAACADKVKELWAWWSTNFPLHCAEIREGRKDSKVCQRLGRLAAAKVEELIRSV